MATRPRAPRNTLTRAVVVGAAIDLADSSGLGQVTMRAVAERLEVRAMALYRHVATKDDLLDAMVENLYADMELSDANNPDWRAELRRHASSLLATLVRHPWALSLLESRSGPDRPHTFQHADAVLRTLLVAGFGPLESASAFVTLDSFVLGFAVQAITMASTDPHADGVEERAAAMSAYSGLMAVQEAVSGQPDYDFTAEFDRGLDLVLDGLERWRDHRR